MDLLSFLRGEYAAGDGDHHADYLTAWDEERILEDTRWADDGGRVH